MENFQIPAVDFNGIEEVGIAVSGDVKLSPAKHIQIVVGSDRVSERARVAIALSSVTWDAGLTPEQSLFMDAAVVAIVVREWFGWRDAGKTIADADAIMVPQDEALTRVPTAAVVTRATAAWTELSRGDTLNKVNLMVAATKVNWWLTNHHTGQGAISGFAGKAAAILSPRGVSDAFKEAMHRVGHYTSTRGVLHALGLRGVRQLAVPFLFPSATRDIKLRIDASPAGTARITTVHAVLLRMESSMFARYAAGIDGLAGLQSAAEAISRSPVRHHVGAAYLSERAPITLPDPSEEIQALAALYAHIVMEGSTLSRARVLMKLDDAAAVLPTVATSLRAMRAAMAQAIMDIRLTDEDIARVTGGAGLNPMEGVIRRITPGGEPAAPEA